MSNIHAKALLPSLFPFQDANSATASRYRRMLALVSAAVLYACIFAQEAFSQVVTYPAPAGMEMSGDYTVKVGGQNVAVYRGQGYDPRGLIWDSASNKMPYSFAYFDYSGSAFVEITSNVRSLNAVRVLPESKGIIPAISGNYMSFTMTKEFCHLSIEPDRKNGPLLLFANPIEAPPASITPGLYFGPGLHKPGGGLVPADGIINVKSGQTMYVAGGAVVQAGIRFSGASNASIRGRGIIDGFPWPRDKGPTGYLVSVQGTDIGIDGIIMKDGWLWNLVIHSSSNRITIKNLKLIANRCGNEDGIDILSAQNVMISDSFIRVDDDVITPKGYSRTLTPTWPAVDHITVIRSTLWADHAHVWRFGAECGTEAMRNMLFKDLDIIHYSATGYPVISLQAADEMPIENFRFENIRVNHEGQANFIEVRPQITQWARSVACSWPTGPAAGRVRNCYFKDIFLTGFTSGGSLGKIWVQGYDSTHDVNGVTFENVVRHGQLTQRTSPNVVVGANAFNIFFTGSGTVAPAPTPVPAPAPTPTPTPTPIVQTQTNNASFVSQSVPATMTAGQSYSVSVTMQNTGTSTWSAAGKYNLGSQNPQDNTTWGTQRAMTSSTDSIAPGQSKTYTFSIKAPSTAGTHNFQWRMVQEQVAWFGALSNTVAVSVAPAVTIPPPTSALIFSAVADFSGTQGARGWKYLDSAGFPLIYDSVSRAWKGAEPYLWIWADGAHPGTSRDVIRRWTAPQAGAISITGIVRDLDAGGGDGVTAIIRKNGVELKRITIANGNVTGVSFSVPTSVAAGNTIDFVINRIGTDWWDSTAFNPTIVLTPAPTSSG